MFGGFMLRVSESASLTYANRFALPHVPPVPRPLQYVGLFD